MKRFLLIVFLTFSCAFTFAQKAGVVASEVDSLASGVIRDYQLRLNVIADNFVSADSVARLSMVDEYNALSLECNAKVFDIYAKHIDKGEYYRQSIFNLRTMVDKSKVASAVKKIKGKDRTESPYAISLNRFVNNEQVATGDKFVDFDAVTVKGDLFKLSDIVNSKDVMLIFGVETLDENSISILKLLYSKADFSLIEVVAFATQALDDGTFKDSVQAGHNMWVNVTDFKGAHSNVVIDYNVVSLPTFIFIGKDGVVKFVADGLSQDVLMAFAK